MFDTDVLVGRECIVQAVAVLATSRNIPLETLEQIMVQVLPRPCRTIDVLQACGHMICDMIGT
jgi:hypothetical protein